DAEHVTMLQRSPTYIASIPEVDPISVKLRKFLPEMVVYRMARTRNIGLQRFVYKMSQEKPKVMRRFLLGLVKKQIGPNVDMKHFEPSYNPWDQRLCAVPRGDLFKTLRRGDASMVTDHIDTFTEKGIRVKSGEEIEADIIISATGLNLLMLGGIEGTVDGEKVDPNDTLVYKGVMLRDVPNMAMVFGYTNSSWTLKADLASEFVCRVLNHMKETGAKQVTPRDVEGCDTDDNFLGLTSGYVVRASEHLPRQGKRDPWRVLNNYLHDLPALRYGKLNDDELEFSQFGSDKKKSRKGLLSSVLGT
ncbi:monooxygenase, flavin-binding family, partial [gamma proteobacterium HTCC5015]